jgi:murein L,D-transpeptidase YafK
MALHISYPDAAHLQRANALGVSPGGDIMVHGLPPAFKDVGAAHRDFDWTEGCIAVTDEEIEEIWRAVPAGSPIQIKP